MKELIKKLEAKSEECQMTGFIKTCECKFKIPDTVIGMVDFQNHQRMFYPDHIRTYCPKCGVEFPKEKNYDQEGDI